MNEYLIYPKQFQRAQIPIERNRCFVIMPFIEELDYVYGIIKQGLNKAGFICNRVDEIAGATPIINKILIEILRSRYIIADLTGCNPNVFYELGIAHSFKDAQNIIILKQHNSKVPFDITHLTYIDYDPDNPKLLTSAILKNISEYSYLAEFHEALNVRGIIPFIKDNGDYFIETLKAELNNSISDLTMILNNSCNHMSSQDVDRFLSKYENLLSKVIVDKQEDIIPGILCVYQEILISTSSFPITEEYLGRFLDGSFHAKFDVHEETALLWQTDMAIALAKAQKMIIIVLPWIIRYFSRTKTATIDLNRYKLEAFLMTTENPKVNELICASIFDRNCYVREHMADIMGEKRMYSGTTSLCKQLDCEDNYYTAVSIIEALGKLEGVSAITHILNWVNTNNKAIISEKQFFVLKHARIALLRLDTTPQKHYIQEFDKKYDQYLKDYFIL